MSRIYIPTDGPEDWRHLLASPERQWRDGYSAKSLALAWQAADGFPPDVRKALDDSGIHAFEDAEMLLGIPEYKVALPGGSAASQNDMFVLAKGREGHIVIMVEGKVNESFGPFVSKWMEGASAGKEERLAFLCDKLGLQTERVYSLRYQLLHRAASALMTAEQFNARHALMLVHSFSSDNQGFDDFAAFAALFGVTPEIGKIQPLGKAKGLSFYTTWIQSDLPVVAHSVYQPLSGKVKARKCPRCGHHEIGIVDSYGRFSALKPGMEVEARGGRVREVIT
ncbi:DUF6946 family protein [Thermodesulfobacteriota bacterium]